METFREFMSGALYAVITVALPVLVKYCITFIENKIAAVQAEKIKSEAERLGIDADLLNKYIDMAEDAVYKAVMETNQTFVDALKKESNFTKEAQAEALNKAIDTAKANITEEAKKVLIEAYGDLNKYLTTSIEALIRTTKTTVTNTAI